MSFSQRQPLVTIIYDSCVIRDLYKRKYPVCDITVMWFQKYQIPKEIFSVFKINCLQRFEKQYLKLKDENFFLLDRSLYAIITYDKFLKKNLKAHKYKVYNSVKELENNITEVVEN